MNDDFENLQKLIALKRFEQPPEGFVDDFMREFHARQREVANRRSSWELFWEKVGGFFDSLSGPAWGAVGATAALVVASFMGMNETRPGQLPSSQGLKAVDFHKTPEEAAFKAFPIILGEENPESKPGDEDAAKKNKEVEKADTSAPSVPTK
jgi:hypothetical protein